MTTSSTWIIACRSAKRWFDLDAVRTPSTTGLDKSSGIVKGGSLPDPGKFKGPNMDRGDLGAGNFGCDPAGAPPLDWHSDLADPAGPIRLADEWQPPARSALELDGLPRKIVLSMCPWAVCRVCGTPRERVTGEARYVRRDGSVLEEVERWESGSANGKGAHTDKPGGATKVRQADTLGWSDCSCRCAQCDAPPEKPSRPHACIRDRWRPGIAYDPAAGVLLHRTSEDDMTLRYIVGDTRDVTATIPDGSVDLIFTSPPFLALRSYLPSDHADKHREIGSEANPAAFLDVLLELTAEWGRVLAPHGTLAVELGDTYSGATAEAGWDRLGPRQDNAGGNSPGKAAKAVAARAEETWARKAQGWPLAKSLACIPQLYMIGLAYGINPLTGEQSPAGRWRVRNWIAWHRPNPPVGALGDKWRPASSYITVACKGAKRWFDLDAVRGEQFEPNPAGPEPKGLAAAGTGANNAMANRTYHANGGAPPLDWHVDGDLGVGHIILSTQPYPGSHYATFPVDLPRKIIDCMCPRQVCTVCGVPRERVVDHQRTVNGDATPHGKSAGALHSGGPMTTDFDVTRVTLGWTDCGCSPMEWTPTEAGTHWVSPWRPGIVYDPFAGSGTTLEAAQDLGRDGIGADLDERNSWLARERLGMFAEFDTLPSTVDVVSDLL